MTKHTPGPWGISEDGNWLQLDGGLRAIKDGRYLSICVAATCDADRRLICAAPDLLEALKHARSQMQHPDQMIDEVIAKAEGE